MFSVKIKHWKLAVASEHAMSSAEMHALRKKLAESGVDEDFTAGNKLPFGPL